MITICIGSIKEGDNDQEGDNDLGSDNNLRSYDKDQRRCRTLKIAERRGDRDVSKIMTYVDGS